MRRSTRPNSHLTDPRESESSLQLAAATAPNSNNLIIYNTQNQDELTSSRPCEVSNHAMGTTVSQSMSKPKTSAPKISWREKVRLKKLAMQKKDT